MKDGVDSVIIVWPIVAGDKLPDDDPEDQLGHGKNPGISGEKERETNCIEGTHVAGIIAGKNDL